MASKKDVITVVLLGKVGSGKSLAGNTLRNREDKDKFFEASIFEKRIREDDGSKWYIFETPGIWDVEKLEESKGLKETCDDMSRLMRHIHDSKLLGVSIFLLVFNIHQRFTNDDKQITKAYEMIFGESEFWKHCIVVMTGGESLEEEFDDWVAEQTGDFQNIIDKCNHSIVRLSSKKNHEMCDKLRDKLVSEVKKRTQALENVYSLDMFMAQEKERKEARQRLELSELPENTDKQNKQIEKIKTSNKQMKTAKPSKGEIKNADDGTGQVTEHFDKVETTHQDTKRSFCAMS